MGAALAFAGGSLAVLLTEGQYGRRRPSQGPNKQGQEKQCK